MDLDVIWSLEAIEDLDSIAEYIAKDSLFYAGTVVSNIVRTARNTSDFPRSGRKVPEINQEEIREQFVYNYRLIYQIKADRILIIAVIHGKRMLGDLSERMIDDL